MIKIIYGNMESVPFNDLAFSMQFMINWLQDRLEKEGPHTQESYKKQEKKIFKFFEHV